MKPINVCIVVFNRYDLLTNLFASIAQSDLRPERVYVIDRGHDVNQVRAAANGCQFTYVELAGQSLPAAWNWFIDHVPEERVIASDDVVLHSDALRKFLVAPGDFVGLDDGESSHFACFSVRDRCVAKVGHFDEDLSPNYMYFEDCDYMRRIHLAGLVVTGLNCMTHGKAQSWEKKTDAQRDEHHKRFVVARENYVAKWGGLPGEEMIVR